MEEKYHIQMTRRALSPFFSGSALEVIVEANTGQDSLRNLLRGEYHFDANAFERAHVYVADQRREVFESARTPETLKNAWQALGRWTHALQDFYSHTNYVALWRKRYPEKAIYPLDNEILDSPDLFAARVYYPLEALTYFKSLRPLLRRLLPPDSHANMNLDSPERGPLFPDALAAAEARTAIEFESLLAEMRMGLNPSALAPFLSGQTNPENPETSKPE